MIRFHVVDTWQRLPYVPVLVPLPVRQFWLPLSPPASVFPLDTQEYWEDICSMIAGYMFALKKVACQNKARQSSLDIFPKSQHEGQSHSQAGQQAPSI